MSTSHLSLHKLRFLDNGPYSFTLSTGECLGLKGPSGVGKTQLFRAISDLIPSVGDVFFNDINKDAVSAVEWRSQVTMLPTDSVWWYDDVSSHFASLEAKTFLDNVCGKLGLPKEIVHWQVSRLSTGEKQRLSLIRSLQVKPAILLLDEPTSALDVVSTELVETLLLRLCKSKTLSLIWVSHDVAQLERVSDRILSMNKTDIRDRA
jgi:UDP-glucose/iron transport system ATP-binding protein